MRETKKKHEEGKGLFRPGFNRRIWMFSALSIALVLLIGIAAAGQMVREEAMMSDFTRKNIPPCIQYPFGTDFMGRDMFLRTLAGLSMSIRIGFLTAAVSALLAFVLGIAAASLGKAADFVIVSLIDLTMGIPHILLLLLISFALGKGFTGVVAGISLTHWTSLARLIRGEVLSLKESQYIKISGQLGHGKLETALLHMTPHLLPQLFVGFVLTFPHAILHEASITFLGFGLSPEQPAIGIILSESMKYLSMGKWWLAFFPGLFLVLIVLLFHFLGDGIGKMIDPASAHQ